MRSYGEKMVLKKRAPNRSNSLALVGGSRTIGGVEIFNSRLSGLLQGSGVAVTNHPLNSNIPTTNRVIWPILLIAALIIALVQLVRNRPQRIVVSCGNIIDVFIARLIAVVLRRKDIVAIAHFNASWRFWQYQSMVRALRKSSQSVQLFCIAPNQKKFFLEQGIIVEKQIFPNFFHYPTKPCVTRKAVDGQSGRQKIVALYAGRINREKQVVELAKFLSDIACSSIHVEFRLAGECPSEIEAEVSILEHQCFSTTFLGRLNQEGVSAELRTADLFCTFSASDTLPLNMLEAAANQVPILTRRNPVTSDVDALVGGLLFAENAEPMKMFRVHLMSKIAMPPNYKVRQLIEKNESTVLSLLKVPNYTHE